MAETSGAKLAHDPCKNKDFVRFKRYFYKFQLIGLCCEECVSEWVLARYATNDNDAKETITISGQEYHLLRKRALAGNQFRIQRHYTNFPNVTVAEECIKGGDHICYKKYLGTIIHHAIVTKVTCTDNGARFTLLQWSRLKDSSNNFEIIEEKDVDLSQKAKSVIRCDYPEDYVVADNIELTIARANAWKGQTDYNVFSNNCEHFATFCKIGYPQSYQQDFLIAKAKSLLLAVIGCAAKVGTGLAKNVAARAAAADAIGDAVEYGVTNGGAHYLAMSTQAIGLGIVLVVNGVIFTVDVKKAYELYKKDELTFSEFKDRIWRNFVTSLERFFFTGILPAACAVGFGVVVCNPGIAASVGFLLAGAIVGGVLASKAEGFGQTIPGRALSFMLRPIIDHSDEMVRSISELRPGDHVVVSQWVLHPRCHIILKSIRKDENMMIAIRFSYDKGVVEEPVPFKKPMYKVIYDNSELYSPEEVIRRANQKRQENSLIYCIFENNCKSFARWCKTGRLPKSLTAIKGYD